MLELGARGALVERRHVPASIVFHPAPRTLPSRCRVWVCLPRRGMFPQPDRASGHILIQVSPWSSAARRRARCPKKNADARRRRWRIGTFPGRCDARRHRSGTPVRVDAVTWQRRGYWFLRRPARKKRLTAPGCRQRPADASSTAPSMPGGRRELLVSRQAPHLRQACPHGHRRESCRCRDPLDSPCRHLTDGVNGPPRGVPRAPLPVVQVETRFT